MKFQTVEQVIARAREVDSELAELAELDELDDDQSTRFDALMGEVDVLAEERARITKRDEARAKVAALAKEQPDAVKDPEVPNFNRGGDVYDVPAYAAPAEYRSRAHDAIEKTADWEITQAQKEQVARYVDRFDGSGQISKLVLATGSKSYKDAWTKAVTGREMLLTDGERASLQRAMSLTNGSGGFAVPFPIDPTLIQLGDGSSNPFRRISRVVPITTDSWQGVASSQLTASWDAEAVEVSDDTTTFTQPTVTAHKAAAFVPTSIEIAGDYPNLVGDLQTLFMDAKDRLEATAFATGSGSGQPFGIVTAIDGTGNDTSSASTDTFALADVYNVHETLGPRYRDRGTWVANVAIINDIRQFATANNYHGFTVDLTAAGVSALLGRPIVESSAMDGTITALAENNVLVFGDFSNYLIADRVGFNVEYIPHLFATANNLPSGQRGFYAYWRVGADSINDDAFVLLNVT